MPDISKLPELAELFGTTIDELLGHHSPLIEKAAEGKLDELLKKQLETGENLAQYAVFASNAAVDEAALTLESQGKSIMQIVPFISKDALNKIVLSRLQGGKSITPLLPFVSQETIQRLFDAASTKD